MNELQKALFDKPSIYSHECPFCGKPATNRHHIIPRSQGGLNGPTIDVCGFGNASGCHGRLHSHYLHLRYENGWKFLETEQPTKYEVALTMDGWQSINSPKLQRLDEEMELIAKSAERTYSAWEYIGWTPSQRGEEA